MNLDSTPGTFGQSNRHKYVGLFLLSLATLVVELLLTKIFDVLLWPNLSFMIISGALFGVGLGGLVGLLRGSDPRTGPSRAASAALLFAVAAWALPWLLNAIPFSFENLPREPVAQGGWFLLVYLALLAPFFASGWCICDLFARTSRDVRRLYCWDLSGAAVGTAILLPLLPHLGPERLLFGAGSVGLVASALFARSWRWRGLVALVAAAFVAVSAQLGPRYFTLALHQNKRDVASSIGAGRLEFLRWDPISQIAILHQPWADGARPPDKHIAYDGGTQSSDFFAFDGDFPALRRNLPRELRYQFWQRAVLAAHYLRRDTGYRALIIGSAGGQETKAALLYGAADIDAVEMVQTVVDLATGPYANYIGRIFQRPEVHVHVAEGRSFVRASRKTYDVIQVFSNYTSASTAAGSGALTPAYLQTAEAYVDYFSHLTPNGILQINHHTYPRMITTAALAWRRLGRTDLRSHVMVFERSDQTDIDPDYLPTVLIKMSPWTPGEVAEAAQFFGQPIDADPPHLLVENPLSPAASFLPDVFYAGELPLTTIDQAPYRVTPVTDDQPAFNFLRKSPRKLQRDAAAGVNEATATLLNLQLRRGWLPMDWIHLIIASCAGLFYGILFVILPMSFSAVGREQWSGKAPAIVYFSLLGVGFIAIEMLFVQIFMELIGYPLHTVTVVITVMLLGAGIGSMSSRTVARGDSSRWHRPFLGLLVTGGLVWLVYPLVTDALIGWPLAVRIAGVMALIAPMAFFMGMLFPMGILELGSKPHGAIAWAWSMNGLCSTIGSVLTVIASLWLGFRIVLILALAVYAVAGGIFAMLRRSSQATSRIVTPQPIPSAPTLVPSDATAFSRRTTAGLIPNEGS